MFEILLFIKLFMMYLLKGRRPVVYISGAITNASEEKRGMFEMAERLYTDAGFFAINPMKLHLNVNKHEWYHYMRIDVIVLLLMFKDKRTKIVCALEGWEQSRGAKIEVEMARALGINIKYMSWEELENKTPSLYV